MDYFNYYLTLELWFMFTITKTNKPDSIIIRIASFLVLFYSFIQLRLCIFIIQNIQVLKIINESLLETATSNRSRESYKYANFF